MSGGGERVLLVTVGESWPERIAGAAAGWRVVDGSDTAVTAADAAEAEILVGPTGRFTETLLAPDSKLKWLQTLSTGVDYLPLARLQKKGVLVSSARGMHAGPVAETALALMLAVARGLTMAAKAAETRSWKHNDFPMERLGELQGKTVGLLGVGTIGRHLAGLCRAFGMTVLGTSHSGRAAVGIDEVFPAATPEAMLARCDFVVNSLPRTPETEGYMNAGRFAAMKPGAVYVAVGRGKTTDTAALVAALQSGKLAGAGLDVVDPEPLPPDSPLWAMDSVLILPHFAGFSREMDPKLLALFAENLAAYEKTGRPEKNLVNLDLGY